MLLAIFFTNIKQKYGEWYFVAMHKSKKHFTIEKLFSLQRKWKKAISRTFIFELFFLLKEYSIFHILYTVLFMLHTVHSVKLSKSVCFQIHKRWK